MSVHVIVNPHAGGGRGAARWQAVAAAWPGAARAQVTVCADVAAARAAVAAAGEAGAPMVVSASGDGGVNLVLNALMDPAADRPRWDMAIGAIGLGSSNDFHKPRAPGDAIAGVPLAVGLADAALVDVGRADWVDAEGRAGTAYFLLNASFGAVARGNHRYNHPTGLLALLKRHAGPDAAIAWATVEGLAAYEPVPATLTLDDGPPFDAAIANLGVIKRVHFAGDMRYDTPVQPADGRFDVNLAADMTAFQFAQAALAIRAGRFLAANDPKLRHWRAARVHVRPDHPTPLEHDGEVVLVREATLRVVPRAIRLATKEPA